MPLKWPCAILPKNGPRSVRTNPEYFDHPWLGQRSERRVSLLLEFTSLLCSKKSKPILPRLWRVTARVFGGRQAGLGVQADLPAALWGRAGQCDIVF